jgi:predicted GIY-YIG superfamily endonuclease
MPGHDGVNQYRNVVARAAMHGGWVYIMTNRPNGTLYTGVTSNIGRRAYEHREGLVRGFTKRCGRKRLVYMEFYETIKEARELGKGDADRGPNSYGQ